MDKPDDAENLSKIKLSCLKTIGLWRRAPTIPDMQYNICLQR